MLLFRFILANHYHVNLMIEAFREEQYFSWLILLVKLKRLIILIEGNSKTVVEMDVHSQEPC